MALNETEKKVLGEFLDRLSEHMGNSGCNDWELPESEEGWALAKEVVDLINEENPDAPPEKPSLITWDWIVLDVIRRKLGV